MNTVTVTLPDHQYDIHIGPDILGQAGEMIDQALGKGGIPQRVMIFADQNVVDLYADRLVQSIKSQKPDCHVFLHGFDSGEERKNIDTIHELYTIALGHGLERRDVMIALGGGVTGDMVGYVAATYLRGIPFIQIPTTLLSMVDSSVGGKTGYNHPLGKNLIGAFKQPELVLIDIEVLKSLPDREYKCGLAECIKHGLLADWSLFEWMESHIDDILSQNPVYLAEFIARNVQIKANIVEKDEKEAGVRALLNFGHSFGHAIEVTSGYGVYKHGEAVAMGCLAACYLAENQKLAPEGLFERVLRLTQLCGLPCYGDLKPVPDLMRAMERDKKVKNGRIHLVLPNGYGSSFVTDETPMDQVEMAWDIVTNQV